MEESIQRLTDFLGNTPELSGAIRAVDELDLPDDLLDEFGAQLEHLLKPNPAASRVFVRLAEFLTSVRSPIAWLSLFERDQTILKTLVGLCTLSDCFAADLIQDPEAVEVINLTAGQPVSREILLDEVATQAAKCTDEASLKRLLRSYRRRETMRIAYGEFLGKADATSTRQQLADLAECLVVAAVNNAGRLARTPQPVPVQPDGSPVRFAVFALGGLGRHELSYDGPINLVAIREEVLGSQGSRIMGRDASSKGNQSDASVDEYFTRLLRRCERFLAERTDEGLAYEVDFTLRPGGEIGPLVTTDTAALDHFDAKGRTWERQAYLSARFIAGDSVLASEFLERLSHWVYRRYLMRPDESGIAALKRRMLQRTKQEHGDISNDSLNADQAENAAGGLADIQQLVEFLQLLYGGDAPDVRGTGTLRGVQRLGKAGLITADESHTLQINYELLSKRLHFYQVVDLFDTYGEPTDRSSLVDYLVAQFSVEDASTEWADDRIVSERLGQNRKIVEHLLGASLDEDSQVINPVSELVLDPKPAEATITATLGEFGFRSPRTAYENLQSLSVENIQFLSTRRCRHFLSAISPQLLESISQTPDPDATLTNLTRIADSIGGKAVLWELFQTIPATLQLATRLCAASPYLTSILTSNPGMIDELLDSLMLQKLPSRESMAEQLNQLCHGADDISAILHSFKNAMHLRIGARNIMRKDPLEKTHQALADVAEVCIEQVIYHEYHRLVRQLGIPVVFHADELAVTESSPAGNVATQDAESGSKLRPSERRAAVEPIAHTRQPTDQTAEFVVLAVGKLGGREPNYHSDVDLIFLYEGEGQTRSLVPDRRFSSTTNRHFFNQLGGRIVGAITHVGTTGRLYDVDVRFRPLGSSGALVSSLDDFRNHFAEGGKVHERQVLCKARPIWGSERQQQLAMNAVKEALCSFPEGESGAAEIVSQRMSLEAGAGPNNIKRATGGTMDIEFAVQALQLVHCSQLSYPWATGTISAIEELSAARVMDDDLSRLLQRNYMFLRRVESGLRLMNMFARHDIPLDEESLARLLFLLDDPETKEDLSAEKLTKQIATVRAQNREAFEAVAARLAPNLYEESPRELDDVS
ncbi:MAG TPA: hypothetical protein DDW52_18575 [Planctomycetaceae bacterium]|nr:hypothetical protein [Planctomycetaceae bacterium]